MRNDRIKITHSRFALFSAFEAIKGGSSFAGGLPCFTDAYLKAFPGARKRRAAAASMSRLLRHPNVQAVRAWKYSQIEGVIPRGAGHAANRWRNLATSQRGGKLASGEALSLGTSGKPLQIVTASQGAAVADGFWESN
jgi:hypothetical protein